MWEKPDTLLNVTVGKQAAKELVKEWQAPGSQHWQPGHVRAAPGLGVGTEGLTEIQQLLNIWASAFLPSVGAPEGL